MKKNLLFKAFRGLYHPMSVVSLFLSKSTISGKEGITRILLFKIDGLGDYVMALRAIISIKTAFPDAEIVQLVSSQNKQLANLISDKCSVYESPFFFPYKKNFADSIKIIKKIKSFAPNMIVDLRGDFFLLTGSIISLPKLKLEIGKYRLKATFFKLLFRNQSETLKKVQSMHETEIYNRIITNANIPLLSLPDARAYLTEALKKAHKGTNRKLVAKDENYLCFHIGGSTSHKRWPVKNYIRLSAEVSRKYKIKILFLGSKEEMHLLDGLNLDTNFAINLMGRTGIVDLLELVRTSKLIVANDSAVGHIAAFWGTPTVTIFGGPSNDNIFRPRGDGVTKIIRSRCTCKNAEQDRCSKVNDWCLNTITVNMVMNEIHEVFEAS